MAKTINSPKVSYLKTVKYIYLLALKVSPWPYNIAGILANTLSASCFVLAAYTMQLLFDRVHGIVEGRFEPSTLVFFVLFAGGVRLFEQALNAFSYIFGSIRKVHLRRAINQKIHEKAFKIPAINYECAETLDCINKAKNGAENAIFVVIGINALTFFFGGYFIATSIYLYSLRPALIFSLVLVLAPTAFAQYMKGRFYSRFIDESAPLERKMDYYERAIYHREFFKETRLLGIAAFTKELYLETLAIFSLKKWRTAKKTYSLEMGLRLITLAGYYGVLYLLLDSLLGGYISIGAFAAVLALVGQMFGFFQHALGFYGANLMKGMGGVKALVQFLNMEEQKGESIELDFSEGISLSNISFRYPNAEKDAVSDISLDIKPGETLALVGANGAGKTTLVRLLMGILPPDTGEIRVGSTVMANVSREELYKKTSAVFQKFQRYKMSLKDNITISNLTEEISKKHLDKAISEAEINIDEVFSEGLDTVLSREFDGIDLSGGQWQRVSLARGLYRACELIVLDEPTSAIDPIEESKLYKKFAEISKEKIALIVTHRLGSAKIADRIVVLDNGHIDAVGHHQQLMEADGLYAKMYLEQAKWYVTN